MIKLLIFGATCGVILSCSSSKKTTNQDEQIKLSDDDKNGIGFIEKGDCYTCHSQKDKLIGPSFISVSAKYDATERNLEMLSKKILRGGFGHWGKIPMTPHPSLSQNEVEAIVKYIFTLKE